MKINAYKWMFSKFYMSNLNENSVSQSVEIHKRDTRIKVQHARMTLIRNFWNNASGII